MTLKGYFNISMFAIYITVICIYTPSVTLSILSQKFIEHIFSYITKVKVAQFLFWFMGYNGTINSTSNNLLSTAVCMQINQHFDWNVNISSGVA